MVEMFQEDTKTPNSMSKFGTKVANITVVTLVIVRMFVVCLWLVFFILTQQFQLIHAKPISTISYPYPSYKCLPSPINLPKC